MESAYGVIEVHDSVIESRGHHDDPETYYLIKKRTDNRFDWLRIHQVNNKWVKDLREDGFTHSLALTHAFLTQDYKYKVFLPEFDEDLNKLYAGLGSDGSKAAAGGAAGGAATDMERYKRDYKEVYMTAIAHYEANPFGFAEFLDIMRQNVDNEAEMYKFWNIFGRLKRLPSIGHGSVPESAEDLKSRYIQAVINFASEKFEAAKAAATAAASAAADAELTERCKRDNKKKYNEAIEYYTASKSFRPEVLPILEKYADNTSALHRFSQILGENQKHSPIGHGYVTENPGETKQRYINSVIQFVEFVGGGAAGGGAAGGGAALPEDFPDVTKRRKFGGKKRRRKTKKCTNPKKIRRHK